MQLLLGIRVKENLPDRPNQMSYFFGGGCFVMYHMCTSVNNTRNLDTAMSMHASLDGQIYRRILQVLRKLKRTICTKLQGIYYQKVQGEETGDSSPKHNAPLR